jgi:hypothetical protein
MSVVSFSLVLFGSGDRRSPTSASEFASAQARDEFEEEVPRAERAATEQLFKL